MIEQDFDIPFIADLALREKQIQQNYRPVIAVHKWFARRPGTLFRGLLLSEFSSRTLQQGFYLPNQFQGLRIADPFMGGGIPLIEANRMGLNIMGYDINPMSYWIVKQEIEHIDLDVYQKAAQILRRRLKKEIGHLYRTKCLKCGNQEAHVKYFLWVKTIPCKGCGEEIDLFPGYLLAQNRRHPKNVFICAQCGALTETDDREHPGECSSCLKPLSLLGPAKRSRCSCPRCGHVNSYPDPDAGPPLHRMFAIEYHCPKCKPKHRGRFFKKPEDHDLSLYQEANGRRRRMRSKYVPDDRIPEGDESSRLLRWGYKNYREMFNSRQFLGLEISCRFIKKVSDRRIQDALATNLSDLLRYQNMVCRYDKMALKSLDIFSVHGFPVGLIQCESNMLGIKGKKKGMNIGSGGWRNITQKYVKAKTYCETPFEVLHRGSKKRMIPLSGEWIGGSVDGADPETTRNIELSCSDALSKNITPQSLDGVFTDPPYFGNVQYAELMDFCYVWLRKLVGQSDPAFKTQSTRNPNELTGNESMQRGLENFTEGLSAVFQKMAAALKPGSPLVFTYHHNALSAYYPVSIAILDAGLTCSASLPCPAEMGASIHINGTGSSIIDTIFVCRLTGKIPRRWIPDDPAELASLVEEDLEKLRKGNVKPTYGDLRCIVFGHLTRLAVWALRESWDKSRSFERKFKAVDSWIEEFGGLTAVEKYLESTVSGVPRFRKMAVHEPETVYAEGDSAIFY